MAMIGHDEFINHDMACLSHDSRGWFIYFIKMISSVESYNPKSFKPGRFALKWNKDFFVETSLAFPKLLKALPRLRLRNIHQCSLRLWWVVCLSFSASKLSTTLMSMLWCQYEVSSWSEIRLTQRNAFTVALPRSAGDKMSRIYSCSQKKVLTSQCKIKKRPLMN